jgi:hypothetical protein
LSYGAQPVGVASASQDATMTNTGGATLLISSIGVTGANASSFAFASTCGPSLATGASCTIHGHFTPTATGPLSAAVTITDNAAGSPQSIALTGTGATPATVSLSATSLTYADQAVETESASQSVTLTNTGSASLTIPSLTVTGPNASSFVFAATCGPNLAAGASCTIHGHFTPTAAGAMTAAVSITDNAAGSPQTISLSGNGGTTVSLSPTSLSFGSEEVGSTSGSQSVTLTNTGTITLDITSIAVINGPPASVAGPEERVAEFAPPSSFVFANGCGTGLAAGASCTIHGHFTPTAPGALTAFLTITDNAGSSPQSITLTGTGLNPAAASLSGTSLSFGSQTVGTETASQTVTLTNTGGEPLLISSIGVTGANASSFVFGATCGPILAAGANCTIHGHFAPTATGALTASVTITDNAGDSPQSITLSGTGQ